MLPRALPLALCACALLALQLPAAAAGRKGGGGGGEPVVRVQQGQLRGRRVEQPGAPLRTYYAFERVPFARPPVGPLRFQDPLEPEPWSGVLNATAPGPICIQKFYDTMQVNGEEDCLQLNVFTADPPAAWATAKRPVMVFIHGGSFILGSGVLGTTRADPIIRRGVVLVTINYRLGVMGFLNTEDSAAPGNAGLKDQVMALRWVKRNIAAFGGNPDDVTAFGFSSGGSSVQFLMLSPLGAGLFHKGLAMSGSALELLDSIDNPRRYAEAMRSLFADRCPNDGPEDIVPCLQRVDASDLVYNHNLLPTPPEFEFRLSKNVFMPALEVPGSSPAPFLTEKPIKLLRDGRFARLPFLGGFVSADGIFEAVVAGLLSNASAWASVDENFIDMYRPEMPYGLRTDEAARRMRLFYFGDQSLAYALNDTDLMNRYVQAASDIRIERGTLWAARLLAQYHVPVFMYEFTHDGPFAFFKPATNASRLRGVCHGDDQGYLFEVPHLGETVPPQSPPEEVAIRERQAELFTNFAKTGNPTPESSGFPRWPHYSAQRERYMDMGAKLTVRDQVLQERIAFWRQLANTPEAQEGNAPAPPRKN